MRWRGRTAAALPPGGDRARRSDRSIDVTIPVSATVPVRVEDTLSILTEVEIDFDVPVRVVISETALGASLDQLEASLRRWGGGDH